MTDVSPRQFIPHSATMFVVALVTVLLLSGYGSPVALFGWIAVTLVAWASYRFVPSQRVGLACGILLIAVVAAQLFYNPNAQIYLLIIASVDVLFAYPEIVSWIVVAVELLGYAAYRLAVVPHLHTTVTPTDTLDGLVLAALMATTLLLYARSIRQLAYRNRLLRRQSATIESLTLSRERARMASHMHDDIGQSLSAIHLEEEATRRSLAGMTDEAHANRALKHLDAIEHVSRDALTQVRQQARALNPEAFGDDLTARTIQSLADSFQSTGLEVTTDVHGAVERIPIEAKVLLYSALQESLTNVVRHARARQAVIHMVVSAHEVTLSVDDDGVGIASSMGSSGHTSTSQSDDAKERADSMKVPQGYGLNALRRRTEAMGGSLTVSDKSALGGASVGISIPLE